MSKSRGFDASAIEQGTLFLKEGKPLIFPTDTVYGLGVAVVFAKSPQALYDLKQRSDAKPIAWLVAGAEALDEYGAHIPDYAHTLAHEFWPGPLTLIVEASSKVLPAFRSQEDTIALRMPNDQVALALIEQTQSPLAVTSANLSGQVAPRLFSEINPDLIRAVPCALGDQRERIGTASTVVDCTGAYPAVIREGDITLTALEAMLESQTK